MDFVMSYSCGKDSTLALHRMASAGHKPIALLVMVNKEMERSWFHGVGPALLNKISESLGIPLLVCESAKDDYADVLERGLKEAAKRGAAACVFGDIDIEDHAAWCRERCANAGIEAVFPLWGGVREEIVGEVVALGYTCLIKCVRNDVLPASMLGKKIDAGVIGDLKGRNIDVCGENGEYHSVVLDGPLFHKPVGYECREILDFGTVSAVNIVSGEENS